MFTVGRLWKTKKDENGPIETMKTIKKIAGEEGEKAFTTNVQARARTQTHTHTHTLARTHTHAHAHTHTLHSQTDNAP